MSTAELSSLATALDDLARRVTTLAEGLANEQQDMAVELYEVERSLNGARRRLRKVVEAGSQPR
ncbi:MAG TPA: hypothetical protein VGO92_00955 [Acidimicrobiales bacterium]|nr:hypothetical protein [Acidimicrobiales bacterium]